MAEVGGYHVTLGTDYGSCVGISDLRLSSVSTGDGETAVLIKKAGQDERTVVSGRAVVTVVILTAVNLLNYIDRFTIAGQSMLLS